MLTTQDYYSHTLIVKTKDIYEAFIKDKEVFDFSNYSTKAKFYNDSTKLVVRKIKDDSGRVSIEELVR